jgi:hypothetical protein
MPEGSGLSQWEAETWMYNFSRASVEKYMQWIQGVGLSSNGTYFFMYREAINPRSRSQKGWFLLRVVGKK